METIKVANVVDNAFSSEQAERLKQEMDKYIKSGKSVTLDFSGVDKFTTLFFNFSTAKVIGELGRQKYDEMVKLKNLSILGESTYKNSYNNATRDDYENASIEKEIINIIRDWDEV